MSRWGSKLFALLLAPAAALADGSVGALARATPFSCARLGNGPADEKELKEFIGKIDGKVNVDELFISPRDKQPYVVFYQIAAAPGAVSVTAHEKVGVSGKKMVGLATGEVRSVDDAELQKLLGK